MPNGIPQIQPYQAPSILNSAARAAQAFPAQERGPNAAAVQLKALEEEIRQADKKEAIEKNEFGMRLLNTDMDMEEVATAFLARYPEDEAQISQLIDSGISKEEMRNALQTEVERQRAGEFEETQAVAERKMDVSERAQTLEEQKADVRIVPPGSGMIDPEGKVIGTIPFKTVPDLFENKKGGQIWVEPGQKIPAGYKRVQKGPSTQVTVQTGDLTKTSVTRIQEEIVKGMHNIRSFGETKKLFKEEYLTLWGKGKKKLAHGLDVLGLSSDDQKKYITERQSWFRQAKADFIAFRKWATGVAGGEKELREIATAFPDPVKNTPTQYLANIESIEDTTKRVLELNVDFLRSGINLEQPLEQIFKEIQDKGIAIPMPDGDEKRAETPEGTGKKTVIKYDKEGKRIAD